MVSKIKISSPVDDEFLEGNIHHNWIFLCRTRFCSSGLSLWYSVNLFLILKGKGVPLYVKQAQRGGRGIPPHILDFGCSKGWVVSATPRPLCSRKETGYPFYYF